jgi:hypothetical protein
MADVARRASFRSHGIQEVWVSTRDRSYQTSKVDRQRARKRRVHHREQPTAFETAFQFQLLAPIPAGLAATEPFDVMLNVLSYHHSGAIHDPLASGQLWAVATLTTFSGEELRRDSFGRPALTGMKLIDTVHAFDERSARPRSHDTVGYVSFPALSINEAGLYRLKVTLMRMDPHAHAQGGAKAVQVLLSHQIVVA